MTGTELVQILTTDLVAILRGRSVPADDEATLRGAGVGWVPANLALTPFGDIATPNPWGSAGDLRLCPDPVTETRVEGISGRPPLHFVLADITELDGAPWSCCSRSFLRAGLAELEQAGFRLVVAFEQEFTILGGAPRDAPSFSLAAHCRAEPFLTHLFAALRQARAEPETILPEYGTGQFEVTCRPAEALAAADRAVTIQAVTREMANAAGLAASFCPKPDAGGVGNGVHVHFSLRDTAGSPVTYDPGRPGNVSAAAGSFVAGVLRHLPALCALTAPSQVSYLRLVPHHWSTAYACFGERNREAAVRICPLPASAADPARSFNLEFRAADATANPYLVLGALVRAGLAGVRDCLPQPPLVNTDPADLTQSELDRLGVTRLPDSLPAALDALAGDEQVLGWFAPPFLETFRGVKAREIDFASGVPSDQLCERYRAIY
ncbi:MAG: glutamine synthetase [Acetobacteraceae bacterium]|nr:glutamine synthetase [Acetobacteraceae bacterium]